VAAGDIYLADFLKSFKSESPTIPALCRTFMLRAAAIVAFTFVAIGFAGALWLSSEAIQAARREAWPAPVVVALLLGVSTVFIFGLWEVWLPIKRRRKEAKALVETQLAFAAHYAQGVGLAVNTLEREVVLMQDVLQKQSTRPSDIASRYDYEAEAERPAHAIDALARVFEKASELPAGIGLSIRFGNREIRRIVMEGGRMAYTVSEAPSESNVKQEVVSLDGNPIERGLRLWARTHYLPANLRKRQTLHPIVLDEMNRKDQEDYLALRPPRAAESPTE